MTHLPTYAQAYALAQELANARQRDYGIEHLNNYWIVRPLPSEAASCGCDYRAQRVKPDRRINS